MEGHDDRIPQEVFEQKKKTKVNKVYVFTFGTFSLIMDDVLVIDSLLNFSFYMFEVSLICFGS